LIASDRVAFRLADQRPAFLAQDRLAVRIGLRQELSQSFGKRAGLLRVCSAVQPVEHLVAQILDFVPLVRKLAPVGRHANRLQ
jgi:hypothetical protein